VKKILAGPVILLAAGLAGCDHAESVSGKQVVTVDLDARTRLIVSVEGVQTRPASAEFERSKEGEPIHRILQSADGKTLFAYDLEVHKSGTAGLYHFLLKPAGNGPTFASTGEVTMKAHEDAVRVELMEQPGTGRKVEDVFRLVDFEGHASEAHDTSIGAHLRRVHEMIRQWVHGD
jgi:hypothetical protein